MFCPKCGSILLPKKNDDKKKKKKSQKAKSKKGKADQEAEKSVPKKIMACLNCGFSSENIEETIIVERLTPKEEEIIEVIDEEAEVSTLPLTSAECPKCKHEKAYFWTVQTRASDEPETKFLKCEKCKHTWRDYS